MEKVNGFIDHIKERFSSPLFYSFIISWVFCNWEIVIALLWYDPPATAQGHLSLINYIDSKANNCNSILYPLGLAMLYTFAGPILRNLISAFQAWNGKWGEAWNLKILKGSKVPIDKYLSFKHEYERRSAVLEKAITSETATQEQLQQTETALLEARNDQNQLKRELSEAKAFITNSNNVNILNGRWIRTRKNQQGTRTENIEIYGSQVYVYEGNARDERYRINDFFYDSNSKLCVFTLFHVGKDRSGFYAYDRLIHRHKGFSGTEYDNSFQYDIAYSRDDEFEDDLIEDDDENQEIADRDYWIRRASVETVDVVDQTFKLIDQIKPGYKLKYNKYYIGLAKGSEVNNFIVFRPKKDYTRFEVKIAKSQSIDELISKSNVQTMPYKSQSGRYRLKLHPGEIEVHEKLIRRLIAEAEID